MESYWDQVMFYLAENQQKLLDVCANEDVDGGSRDRLFELVVIQRCQKADFRISEEIKPVSADKFSGKLLRYHLHLRVILQPDGLYIPYNPNFSAIDMIWKIGTCDWRANPCELSRKILEGLCRGIKLYESCTEIEMWYLSPTAAAQSKVARFVGTHACRGIRHRASSTAGATTRQLKDNPS